MANVKSAITDKIYLQELENNLLVQKIITALSEIPQETLIHWLKKENDKTVSLVLCLAPADLSAKLLKNLNTDQAQQSIQSMAKMGMVHQHALESLFEVLQELQSNSLKLSHNLGGLNKVTQILENLAPNAREELIQSLENSTSSATAELGQKLRSSLLNISKLATLFPKDLAFLCSKLHDHTLAAALYKEHESVIGSFLKALPESRRQKLKESFQDFSGSNGRGLRLKEKNHAIETVIALAAELQNQGKLSYPWDEHYA